MIITGELFIDIIWHANVYITFFIIPCQTNAAIEFSFPIHRYCVVLLDGCQEMVRMLLAHVLHPEVIYDEGEGDWAGDVFPQVWGVRHFKIALLREAFS